MSYLIILLFSLFYIIGMAGGFCLLTLLPIVTLFFMGKGAAFIAAFLCWPLLSALLLA